MPSSASSSGSDLTADLIFLDCQPPTRLFMSLRQLTEYHHLQSGFNASLQIGRASQMAIPSACLSDEAKLRGIRASLTAAFLWP